MGFLLCPALHWLYKAPMLTAYALTIARGAAILARDIGCHIGAGDTLLLTGPNGAGKTTFLRTMAGLLAPDTGHVDKTTPSHWIAAQPLPSSLETVGDYLAFHAALMGVQPVTPRDVFGIAPVMDTPLYRLSTGWRQRVKLTRLLLCDRALWLLDEPSDGLDAGGIAALQSLITAHTGSGGAVVIATHQPHLWPAAKTMTFGGQP